jgi:uncharacterized membrane protein YgcG
MLPGRPARHVECSLSLFMKSRAIVAAALALAVTCAATQQHLSARAARQGVSLDQLLAPIALYPDQLLAQILISAGDPGKVTELDQWLKTQTLKGSQLQDAAVKKGFEPSFVALATFPQVVTKMAADIKWTTQLGQAFVADRDSVFASIQRLRKQAKDVGTLKTTAQQEVTTKTTSGGGEVIVIEPANPQVVYVPQYNSQVVYTQAPTTSTVVIQEDNSDAAVAAGLIGFTAGIAIGAAFDNDYYYGPYGWHGGAYMYNDAWDDYWDNREDAREDWADHREDLSENRSDAVKERSENRSDVAKERTDQRTDRQQNRTENRPEGTAASTRSTERTGSTQARGYGDGSKAQAAKESRGSGASTDAFSGYSSGKSSRASSDRGQRSRSSSGSRGGGGSRSGGGRRR